ncbi:MAG: M48 family metallopeptidase [Muribaculaceae bacterium]|nr:M48 family metallopeptidase [Muribaculaceae bacterium]
MYRTIIDPQLGEVRITWRRTSRLTARWDKGRVSIIVPLQCPAENALKYLEDARSFLVAHRKTGLFEIGRPLKLDGGPTIHFEQSMSMKAGHITANVVDASSYVISVSMDIDMNSPEADGMISRVLMKVARHAAPATIIPEVRAEATRLGLNPNSISISRGHKVLGHCSPQGDIAISGACMFLPYELRRYVYCHELAHLTEMNHSERFHRLCNQYLGGTERQLIAALKNYKWPVLR